jgi:hypothetical protein
VRQHYDDLYRTSLIYLSMCACVISTWTLIHTYIGTANSLYVTLVFGARSGSPRITVE